jgi:hypothetical protein
VHRDACRHDLPRELIQLTSVLDRVHIRCGLSGDGDTRECDREAEYSGPTDGSVWPHDDHDRVTHVLRESVIESGGLGLVVAALVFDWW